MRKSTMITLGASAAFGVLAIVLARGFIDTAVSTQYEQAKNQRSHSELTIAPTSAPSIKTISVMVADMRLMPGDTLTEQTVNLVDFPAKSVPEGSFMSYAELFTDPNNPAVVLTQMAQGEPILAFKLSAPGGRASLSANLGENMRAVSIRVNDVSGVAGFVQPNDRVDVLLTREVEPAQINRFGEKSKGSDMQPVFTAGILLQNIKVLGTDQITQTDNGAAKLAKTITLEVSAHQAQKLALAKSVGTLSLALRAAGSFDTLNASTMNISDLSGKKAKPRRSAARAKRKTPISQTAQVVVVRDGQPRLVKVHRAQTKEMATAALQNLAGGTQ